VIAVIVLLLAWRAGARFPWGAMAATFANADPVRLTWAALISLAALGAKGWAWHLLLRPVAKHPFWLAQEANLVGAAVNSLSVAVIGEAARVRFLVNRSTVAMSSAVASVVWTRALEGIGLAAFILAGGMVLPLPALARGAQIGAAAVIAGLGVLVWFRGWRAPPAWLPAPARKAMVVFGEIGSWRRVVAPIGLALVNWIAQWATYHLTLAATGIPTTPASSFTATLASNIGGALRLTPGNVGITQAAIAVALLPFGVNPAEAVAASIVLQALQVLPVLGLSLLVVGWKGLRQLGTKAPAET
jgi:putative heme transporter